MKSYIVNLYNDYGDKYHSKYKEYDTLEKAEIECIKRNEYEISNLPEDDGYRDISQYWVYKVDIIDVNTLNM